MDSYGLIWTLMDLYGLLSKVKYFIACLRETQAYKAYMNSYGLIWTLMGSKQMKGFQHHMRRIGIRSSYGLL